MGLCNGMCLRSKDNINVDLDRKTKGSVILAESKRMDQVARYMQKLYSGNY
jgi:hypothetical protein